MPSKLTSNIAFLLIFITCLFLGYQFSLHKILWKDELNTQVLTIERLSFIDIIQGNAVEGANNPLYYLVQKSIIMLAKYKLPFEWGSWVDGSIYHIPSQILIRVTSNIYMSLAVALMARFFVINFSIGAGLLSLVTSLSSYMVLAYWVEARPYSLWFLLSVLQIIFLIKTLQSPQGRGWKYLAAVNFLLSLTIVASIGQVVAATALLFINKQREWRKHVFLVLVPGLIYLYYLAVVFKRGILYAYVNNNPLELINDCFSFDRLLLLLMLVLIFIACRYFCKFTSFGRTQGLPLLKSLIVYSILIIIFAFVLLAYYKLKEIPGAQLTGLNSRCIIFLTPLENMLTVAGIIYAFRFLKENKVGLWVWQFSLMVVCVYIIHIIVILKQVFATALFAYY